ncbi:MAG: SDR family oxidoreductase [Rhodobacteraceae bacterium]|nr:SDR family oxidoreductase [Paracoccaceae bacterium]
MGPFDLHGRTAVVTGASGAIGGAIALGLARAGADLALCHNRGEERAAAVLAAAEGLGVRARRYRLDVLDPEASEATAAAVAGDFGRLDVLVNAAGGNLRAAMTGGGVRAFDLALEPFVETMRLNFIGGVVAPCLAFGRRMVAGGRGGSIVNITSMNAFRPLEGRPAYAAAKAAVSNFTQWLACHVAREYTPELRVNAIAPGFFPNERMRDTLYQADGSLSERGARIVAHTPMGRLGEVEDLVGTAIWYAADASRFVTGTVTPVDGGFNAFAGL